MVAAAGRLLDGFAGFDPCFRSEIVLLGGFRVIFRIRQIGGKKIPGQENPHNAFMFSQPAKPPRSTGVAVGGGVDKPSARNRAPNKLTLRIKRKATPLQNSA